MCITLLKVHTTHTHAHFETLFVSSDTVLPTPPISFDVSQASILAGLFDMTASANTSELPAATDISAYIFSIDNGNETFYVVHVSGTLCA